MLFETVKSEGLAHLSYVLGDPDAGVCAVIDPRRDVERYLQTAQQHQVQIPRIVETHVHADFVSGSRELAARTGAPIYGGASEDYDFEIEPLTGGDTLEVGALTLDVLATPGHSPEHISLAMRGGGKGAEEKWGVFAGDTLPYPGGSRNWRSTLPCEPRSRRSGSTPRIGPVRVGSAMPGSTR